MSKPGNANEAPAQSHCSTLPDGTAARRNHVRDRNKLPRQLRSLMWMNTPEKQWHDGDTAIVAVPVCDHSKRPDGPWSYELSVVTIRCDEHYFRVELSTGDEWGWELDDADWFVRLNP